MTSLVLASLVATNAVLSLAGTYCSYTNAPCRACVRRAEIVLARQFRYTLPDGMRPPKKAKPKEPAVHILGRKYPVKRGGAR